MGILNITNRTENWKTAEIFCRLSGKEQRAFVNSLSIKSGNYAKRVNMELFWRGVRDYRHGLVKKAMKQEDEGRDWNEIAQEVDENLSLEFWNSYRYCFGELGENVCEWPGLNCPDAKMNYGTSEDYRNSKDQDLRQLLYSNLVNTELDIVFETADHLFIGEAKHESNFGTDGNLVLVHQLIRQYVTAKLLIEVQRDNGESTKEVIPFLVVDDVEWAKRTKQVKFMQSRKWLCEKNIVAWPEG